MMAQSVGAGALSLELPEGSRVGGVKEALAKKIPSLAWPAGTMLAVNMEYAGPEAALKDGDEVAVIPPVSGG